MGANPEPAPQDRRMRDEMGDETISSDGASDTKEAEALAAALNHSAERTQTLWFTFVIYMAYLALQIPAALITPASAPSHWADNQIHQYGVIESAFVQRSTRSR